MPLTGPAAGAPTVRALLRAALAAGLAAGLVTGILQQIFLVPLMIRAEVFATAALPEHADQWQPQPGLERVFYGMLFNCLGAVGFALLLAAGYALRGGNVTWRQGLLWEYAAMRASPWRRLPGRVRGKTGIPRELARSFAFGSLAISLVLWLMLGVLAALLMGPKAADS